MDFGKVTIPESEIVKSEIEHPIGKFARRREAMDQSAKRMRARTLRAFSRNRDRVGIGIATVHDERQADCTRSRDMRAKESALYIARTAIVMIVEPGFADADDLRMVREGNELVDAGDRARPPLRADGRRPCTRGSAGLRRSPAPAETRSIRVQIVSIVPTPAAGARRARHRMPARAM